MDHNDTNMQLVIKYVFKDIIGSLIFTNYVLWLSISSLIMRKIKRKTSELAILSLKALKQ